MHRHSVYIKDKRRIPIFEPLCKAITKVSDNTIDFFKVKLTSGRIGFLDCDEHLIDFTEDGFEAEFYGVSFDGEYTDGWLQRLKGMKIIRLGLYSELEPIASITIQEMQFEDVPGHSFFRKTPFSYVRFVEDYKPQLALSEGWG